MFDKIIFIALYSLITISCSEHTAESKALGTKTVTDKIQKTEQEWRQQLSEQEFSVLREKGTERAFSGKYHNNKEAGKYYCKACGNLLFSSTAKFDSGTGWPSFYQPENPDGIETEVDRSFFMKRTEVHCARCGGHLGHVFQDGPQPTGLRYCINSISLQFKNN